MMDEDPSSINDGGLAISVALMLTISMLAGVNQLATKDVGELQMAAAAASAPAAAAKS